MTQQAPPPITPPQPQPESDFYWEKCKEHETENRPMVKLVGKLLSKLS